MIALDQANYTKVLNFFLTVLGYGYRCASCDRQAKIIQVSCSEFGFDWVSWECPKCKNRWNHELQKKPIRELLS